MKTGRIDNTTILSIDNIISELRTYITTRFAVPENDPEFTNTVDLFSYGYIDSLGAADLTSFIESRFAITFTDADWVTFPLSSAEEIARFVSKRKLGEV
jgi:acyl carrier protein